VNIGKIKLYYNVKECFSFIFHNHFHISQFSLMAKLGSFAVSQKNECPLLTNFCQKNYGPLRNSFLPAIDLILKKNVLKYHTALLSG